MIRNWLYWILLVYLVVGYFWPIVGWAAFICMIGPVTMSAFKGRFWCGNVCPRGSYYDQLVSRISLNRRIPEWLRTIYFRTFMVAFIFIMFGIQMYGAWGDWAAMGKVFWTIILVTTIVGTLLGIVFSPRAWCTFCPMGSLSAWVAPRQPGGKYFSRVCVGDSCVLCKRCAKTCPMQLKPYEAKGIAAGLMDPDCIKCGKCIGSCPKKTMEMKK